MLNIMADHAKRKLPATKLKELEDACDRIADDVQHKSALEREEYFGKIFLETLKLYEAGRKYAVNKGDVDKCVELGKALKTFDDFHHRESQPEG